MPRWTTIVQRNLSSPGENDCRWNSAVDKKLVALASCTFATEWGKYLGSYLKSRATHRLYNHMGLTNNKLDCSSCYGVQINFAASLWL